METQREQLVTDSDYGETEGDGDPATTAQTLHNEAPETPQQVQLTPAIPDQGFPQPQTLPSTPAPPTTVATQGFIPITKTTSLAT